jgi:hypothetical protein
MRCSTPINTKWWTAWISQTRLYRHYVIFTKHEVGTTILRITYQAAIAIFHIGCNQWNMTLSLTPLFVLSFIWSRFHAAIHQYTKTIKAFVHFCTTVSNDMLSIFHTFRYNNCVCLKWRRFRFAKELINMKKWIPVLQRKGRSVLFQSYAMQRIRFFRFILL